MPYSQEQLEAVKQVVLGSYARRYPNMVQTDKQVQQGVRVVCSHLYYKHSHHMSSFYSNEEIQTLKQILPKNQAAGSAP